MREVVQVSAIMRIIEQTLGIAGDALVGLRGRGKWRPRDTCAPHMPRKTSKPAHEMTRQEIKRELKGASRTRAAMVPATKH
jgi:hypothetical protein